MEAHTLGHNQACCDRLAHEIPKLKQKAVIMKLAHQSSYYTVGTIN